MPYVDRDQAARVAASFAVKQYDGQEFLPDGHPDLDPPPTDDDLRRYAVDKRFRVETGGITRNGLRLPTSREKRAALKDLADKMRDGPLPSPAMIGLSDSVAVSLTLAELDAMLGEIALHCQAAFDVWGRDVLPAIGSTMLTLADVDAAAWPSNA